MRGLFSKTKTKRRTKTGAEAKQVQALRRYYLYGLIPFAFFFFMLSVFSSLDLLNQCLVILGFLWPYSLMAPRMGEKMRLRRNRYSFLRFSLFCYAFIEKRFARPTPWMKKALALGFLPFFFSLFLRLISPVANPAFVLLGLAWWFVFWGLEQRFEWKLMTDPL